MHQQLENDPQTIFQERRNKFLHIIKNFKNSKLKQINEKADKQQEFQVGRIRKQGQQKSKETTRKMQNDLKVAKKIFQSRKTNEYRMQQMKIRYEMIERLQQEAKKNLTNTKKNAQAYHSLLVSLIKQGFIKLLQQQVEIRCLKSQQQIVKKALEQAVRQFNEICEVKCKAVINQNNYLNQEDLGGIILTSFKGKIVCDNTFRARLDYTSQLFLPQIRKILFEKSDDFLSKRRAQKRIKEALHRDDLIQTK